MKAFCSRFLYAQKNIDGLIALVWFFLALLANLAVFGQSGVFRGCILLLFATFFPGYLFYIVMFPQKRDALLLVIALSLVFSLSILAIVAFAMVSFFVPLRADTLHTYLSFVYFTLMIVAFLRRMGYLGKGTDKEEDTFRITRSSRLSYILFTFSVLVVILTIVFIQPQEKFTEFMVVDQYGKLIDSQPFSPDDYFVYTRLVNQEGVDANYTIVITRVQTSVSEKLIEKTVFLPQGQEVIVPMQITTITKAPSYLQVNLYLEEGNAVYRSLILKENSGE